VAPGPPGAAGEHRAAADLTSPTFPFHYRDMLRRACLYCGATERRELEKGSSGARVWSTRLTRWRGDWASSAPAGRCFVRPASRSWARSPASCSCGRRRARRHSAAAGHRVAPAAPPAVVAVSTCWPTTATAVPAVNRCPRAAPATRARCKSRPLLPPASPSAAVRVRRRRRWRRQSCRRIPAAPEPAKPVCSTVNAAPAGD
jgi:hypothetical protein